MKQRKWTAEEKLAIVLEGLKEKRFVAEIERLQKVIGKEAIQIEILKKQRGYLEQDRGSGDAQRSWIYD